MTPLPRLMVAPNGARRGKSDHPQLPVTDDEVVQTAIACHAAGADGVHLHIRDAAGAHLLDAPRYQALLDRLKDTVPGMYLQVTSESAGQYTAQEQRGMMRALRPAHVSVAMREMVRGPEDWAKAHGFYAWALENAVDVQHILYSPKEVAAFVDAVLRGQVPGDRLLIQLVQGSYAEGSEGALDLDLYLAEFDRVEDRVFDWMLCAFGKSETASLVHAARLGGKARAGFENALHHSDGTLAVDNASRIREIDAALRVAVPEAG
ncbi:3-keto-5-aminohexanoate cleavage protein [Tateyamaria sp.]|uniref:3-keto-5-aminohexanoate cleavage protein n=1 Tax=Tateyamaria sp. TaxID=1929288 RepID=UPI00329CFD74